MKKDRRLTSIEFHGLAVLLLILLALMLPNRAAEAATWHDHGQFRAMAQELLAGIREADLGSIPAAGGYGRPRVAVLPFALDEDTLPQDILVEINARLLAELMRDGRRTLRFVARDALSAIIREIDTLSEAAPAGGDREDRAANLLRNARVDILVIGTLRRTGDELTLSYKAVSTEDGTLFAATRPRRIPDPSAAGMIAAAPPAPPAPPAPTLAPPVAVTPAPRPAVFRLPSTGLKGRPTVHTAQRLLVGLGYAPGPADGIVRPAFREALRAFQRDTGLPADGRLTREVGDRLQRAAQ